ncbi:MAG: methyltransferase [Deltaproteobacteria bacterium RIFCSPHIGHO2_02_FULL_40_11]|nr:MAG: methyltransferase [Deltaproteobacteria bacterium RIFCSPHIGHO2_02_FULL_40_11]
MARSVQTCQICNDEKLESILFLGFLPAVNEMYKTDETPSEQKMYPAELLYCKKCHLVQLGSVVDAKVLFPKEYPYTSSTTKILRENFGDLYREASSLFSLKADDLVVDIGSNDGNLLSNFKDHTRVLGVTPEDIGKIAIERGIPTLLQYFTPNTVLQIKKELGLAKIVTATNVFAHIDNVHTVVENICSLLPKDGVFISESHYFPELVRTLQYDTVYHEHLRYYSVLSLQALFQKHDLEIFHVKKIPTHGGSIRVYAARPGTYAVQKSVGVILKEEANLFKDSQKSFQDFRDRISQSKLDLYQLLHGIKQKGEKIYGIGAPSRSSTLVSYLGLDQNILSAIVEIKGSHKIGKNLPGTHIPILEESKLYEDQPAYAFLLSWHIADELAPKIKQNGYKGKFIVPLPTPRVIA